MKLRLSLLSFLQFAVWGTYLVSLGQYLGSVGLGADIQWFYAAGGFVALIMPALMGAVSDRSVSPVRLLGVCHLLSALFMGGAWIYGMNVAGAPSFGILFSLFFLSVVFYIPTLSLSNSTSFILLKNVGVDPVKTFPSIRVWGTIGFVAMMWLVNSMWIVPGEGFGFTLSESSPHAMQRMQYTVMQLGACSVVGVLTALYSFSLPRVAVTGDGAPGVSMRAMLGLLSDRRLLPYFIFSMLIGVALQVNNGYVAPYLTHFRGLGEYVGTFGASNATFLSSISQISEALWILPVGFILAGGGIRTTVLIAIAAWVINFLGFAFGNPGSGLWLVVSSMLVYGVAFNFFNVAGALYVDREAPANRKGAAQGLLMMTTKGVGASVGMLVAGAVVNRFCHWEMVGGHRYFMGDWVTVWLIFAAYIALVGVAFALVFSRGNMKNQV